MLLIKTNQRLFLFFVLLLAPSLTAPSIARPSNLSGKASAKREVLAKENLTLLTPEKFFTSLHPAVDRIKLVRKIYGKGGAQVSQKSILLIEDLLYELDTSSEYEKMCAYNIAAKTVRQELDLHRKSLEDADVYNTPLIEHNLQIIEIQADHYARCARLIQQDMSWYRYLFEWAKTNIKRAYSIITSLFDTPEGLNNIASKLMPYSGVNLHTYICWWVKKTATISYNMIASQFSNSTNPIQNLASSLIQYAEVERTEIFTNHQKTLSLIVRQNNNPLPLVMRFWDYPPYRHRLIEGAKQYSSVVKPQAGALLDVGAEVGEQLLEEAAEAASEQATEAATEAAQATAQDAMTSSVAEDAGVTEEEVTEFAAAAKSPEELLEKAQNEAVNLTKDDVKAAMNASDTELKDAVDAFEGVAEEELISVLDKYEVDIDAMGPKNFKNLMARINSSKASVQNFRNAVKVMEPEEETTVEETEDAFSDLDSLRAKLEAVNKAINPLEIGLRGAEKVETACGVAAKKVGAFLNKSSTFRNVGQTLSKKFEDLVSGPAEEATTKEKVFFYLKNPGKILTRGGLKLFNLARKCTMTNIYRLLMSNSMGEMLVSMMEQSEVMMGGQVVSSWISAANAKVFLGLMKKRTALTNKLSAFSSKLGVSQQNIKTAIDAQFSARIAQIAAELSITTNSSGQETFSGLLPSLLSAEQTYLTNALITTTVKQVFLTNPMIDDQNFYYAPMTLSAGYTPSISGIPAPIKHTWYNIYNLGNWEFCSTDYSQYNKEPVTSFVQYQTVPLATTASPQGDAVIASQNTLFAEYIPTTVQREKGIEISTIAIECILLEKPQAPYMMGIIFNGARWISGVLDFQNQHRLFCIYTAKDQAPGTISVGFAESFYQNQASEDLSQDQLSDQNTLVSVNAAGVPTGFNAVWPAFQLLTPDIDALALLAGKNLVTPITNPIATIPEFIIGQPYIFTIKAQASAVTLTITKPDGTIIFPQEQKPTGPGQISSGSGQGLAPVSNHIEDLNELFFLYHNIGFMSAGCSTQFIINEPYSLCYSKAQIAAISSTLSGEQS